MTLNVRLVIGTLAAALLLSIGGIVFLNALERAVDDVLKQLAIGSLTALAGILAKTSPDTSPAELAQTMEAVRSQTLDDVRAAAPDA